MHAPRDVAAAATAFVEAVTDIALDGVNLGHWESRASRRLQSSIEHGDITYCPNRPTLAAVHQSQLARRRARLVAADDAGNPVTVELDTPGPTVASHGLVRRVAARLR